MADDGMLLNFSLGDAPLLPKVSVKGGTWKARQTAKRAAVWRQRNPRDTVRYTNGNPNKAPLPLSTEVGERSAKRQRVDEDFRPASVGHAPREGGGPRQERGDGHAGGKPKQIISSLFSFNPEATTKPEEAEAEDAAPVKPTNAPLGSELDTFLSLGLSESVASHLLNKMEIKAPTAIQKAAVAQLLSGESDAFIQAETGSGKTLAYLLPIVQRLVNISDELKSSGQESALQRNSGLLAVVLAPTRELAKQISVVLENLLRCAHWIVPGTVVGGEKKKSEKARLRKGVNVLVATPGRLTDHLDNTSVLDVSNVRWLVLDEGDRLMELGFEKDIQKIVSALNIRKSKNPTVPGLPAKRTTVLCSATMKMDVQRLGEISLKEAVHIHANPEDAAKEKIEGAERDNTFSAPAQLKQSFAVVPAKLRLVTLVATLKRAFARKGSVMKAIIFISCADSVDFHFDILTRPILEAADAEKTEEKRADSGESDAESGSAVEDEPDNTQKDTKDAKKQNKELTMLTEARTVSPATFIPQSSNLPKHTVQIYRLHGSLPQAIRTATLRSYTKCTDPAILICTDVASRGLDLPNVDWIIEYDPAFSRDEHLHRVGRTARAGRDGRAMVFLQPGCEEGYVEVIKEGRRDGGRNVSRTDADELLKRGFDSKAFFSNEDKKSARRANGVATGDWEEKATDWQLDIERWVLDDPKHLEQARRAYQSHVRAYATHVATERQYFDLKQLHLGHLAKAFALRDKPGSINVPGLRPGKEAGKEERRRDAGLKNAKDKRTSGGKQTDDIPGAADADEARRKMRMKMREMGGASEFNLG